jgi:hypothetical protein
LNLPDAIIVPLLKMIFTHQNAFIFKNPTLMLFFPSQSCHRLSSLVAPPDYIVMASSRVHLKKRRTLQGIQAH